MQRLHVVAFIHEPGGQRVIKAFEFNGGKMIHHRHHPLFHHDFFNGSRERIQPAGKHHHLFRFLLRQHPGIEAGKISLQGRRFLGLVKSEVVKIIREVVQRFPQHRVDPLVVPQGGPAHRNVEVHSPPPVDPQSLHIQ